MNLYTDAMVKEIATITGCDPKLSDSDKSLEENLNEYFWRLSIQFDEFEPTDGWAGKDFQNIWGRQTTEQKLKAIAEVEDWYSSDSFRHAYPHI